MLVLKKFYTIGVLLLTLIALLFSTSLVDAKTTIQVSLDKKSRAELKKTIKNAIDHAIILHPTVHEISSQMKKEIIAELPSNIDKCKCLLYQNEVDEFAKMGEIKAARLFNGFIFSGNYEEVLTTLIKAQARYRLVQSKLAEWQKNENLLKVFERKRKEIQRAAKDPTVKVSAFGITDVQSIVASKVANSWPTNDQQLLEKVMLAIAQESLTYSELIPNLSLADYFGLAAYSFLETYDDSLFGVSVGDMLVAVILKSTLSTFDPHSDYLTSVESAEFISMTTHYSPVGFGITTHPHGAFIHQLMEGSPAIANGIKVGDLITEINGIKLSGLDNKEIHMQIRNLANERYLTVKFVRDGQPLSMKIDKDLLPIESEQVIADADPIQIKIKKINNKTIGILSFPMFFDGSANVVREKLQKVANKLDGLVIDLRFNGGGSLNDVTKMAYMFQNMNQNTVWYYQNPKDFNQGLPAVTNLYFDGDESNYSQILDKPIVVLVNNASASASELLAGTLKIHGKALVVGSKHTFGKGSVQELGNRFWFDNEKDKSFVIHGALKLTRDLYFLSDGSSPQFTGIESHIEIKGSYDKEEGLERNRPHAIKPIVAEENPLATNFFPENLSANVDRLKETSLSRQQAWSEEKDPIKNQERVLEEAQRILVDWINQDQPTMQFVGN